MSIKVKPNKLSEFMKARDNQLEENDMSVFNRRCWTMIISGELRK